MSRYKIPIQPFLFWIGMLLFIWGIIGWFLPFDGDDPYYTDAGSNAFYLSMGFVMLWAGFALWTRRAF